MDYPCVLGLERYKREAIYCNLEEEEGKMVQGRGQTGNITAFSKRTYVSLV